MKAKRSTFTFGIDGETRTALERIAAGKEWSVGHLVNRVLTEYVSGTKPARTRKAVVKKTSEPAAAEDSTAPL